MSDALDQFDAAPPAALLEPRKWAFLGKPLAPYSFGRRLLFWGIFSAKEHTPPDEVFTLALLHVLSISDAEARENLYHVATYREKLYAWLDTLSVEDYQVGVGIANEILDDAKKGAVSVETRPGVPQKKT